jgi:hypothetical protein
MAACRDYPCSEWIDDTGGTLEVTDKFKMIVPDHAVSNNTEFEVTELSATPTISGATPKSSIVKVTPTGTYFNGEDVTIQRKDYDSCRSPKLYMSATIVDPHGWTPVPDGFVSSGWCGGTITSLNDYYFLVAEPSS